MLLEIILGVAAALVSVYIVRYFYPKRDHKNWRMGLIIAALIYVLFAIIGQRWEAIPLEILGLVMYGVFAYLSKKYSLIWLALGWGLHVAWDVFLHGASTTTYVPAWYPGVCLGFDLVIAAYIIYVFWERKAIVKG